MPTFGGLPLTAWVKIAVVSLLLLATFRFNLVRLWLKTNPIKGEANWRHAIFIPLVGLYYLYVNRDDLLGTTVRHSWGGLTILLIGLLMFAYGIYPGQNDFVKDIGMVVSVFGTVWMLAGPRVMKVAWFPIAFLLCALPWPDQLYSTVASPLQHLAASIAVGVMRVTGVDAYNFGTKVTYLERNGDPRTLNVAEACAGLRSLMTFVSVGAAVAFLSMRPLWQKLGIVVMTVPIAVFCNVGRVAGQGLIDRYVNQQWSEGFAHQFVGIFMLFPGFLMVLATGWLLDRLFVEVGNTRRGPGGVYQASTGAGLQWKSSTQPIGPERDNYYYAPPATSMSGKKKKVTRNWEARKPVGPRAPAQKAVGLPAHAQPRIPPAAKPVVPPSGLLSIALKADLESQKTGKSVENPPPRRK